jgi:hypothetical protein
VKSVRSALAAVVLIAAFLAASVAPAFAGAPRPPCAAAAHTCCHSAAVKACCAQRDTVPNPATPAQSTIQLAPAFAAAPIWFFDSDVRGDLARAIRPHTAPQRGEPLDLPTFLSTLLI